MGAFPRIVWRGTAHRHKLLASHMAHHLLEWNKKVVFLFVEFFQLYLKK